MGIFQVSAVSGEHSCTLTISGDADLSGAPDIVVLGLAALEDDTVWTLQVDLQAVTFMDSTCLGALVTLRNHCDALGKRMTLDGVPPRVQRLLTITGLDTAFKVHVRDAEPV
jgi:anti-anti-sigma factor